MRGLLRLSVVGCGSGMVLSGCLVWYGSFVVGGTVPVVVVGFYCLGWVGDLESV